MRRSIQKFFLDWKTHSLRTPLIVRGARQVGKTFAIEAFGRSEFESLVTINFENSPQLHSCFDTLDPRTIIGQLELLSQTRIIPGKTLLFFDEVQQCPRALQSLRYFKENLDELHVIAAGSLLEFAIRDELFSFPVGRIRFLRMYPLSFEEFLYAMGDEQLVIALHEFDFENPPAEAIHQYLLERMKLYFVIGGMPAALLAFLNTKSLLEVRYAQKALLDAYIADFGKYAKQSQHRHLKRIFEQIPRLIGEHIKYNRIDPELPNPARDMKLAIELLRLAGLLHIVTATSAGSLPLLSGIRESIFKLLFLDIGLVHQAMDIDPQFPSFQGSIAEQFVGQELLANADPFLDARLFFWTRENSDAEVDYLFNYEGVVYPIEVKAGKAGRLKSLHLFIQEKKAPFGIKISQEPLGRNQTIISVPFYLTSHLPRLIRNLSS